MDTNCVAPEIIELLLETMDAASFNFIAVDVQPGSSSPIGRKHVLFSARPYVSEPVHQAYDVAPDGRRFVMIRRQPGASVGGPGLVIVENFFEELKRKVPR